MCVCVFRGSRAYIVNTLWGKNGLHAFGNNSAKGEPIWMKSGTVWAKCGGLADFGRDPRSSDSLRGIIFTENAKISHKILRSCDFRPVVVTPQWLQIAGNSSLSGPSTGCLVSIFRSTRMSRPNKVGLKCPSIRPSVHKKFLRFQWNLVCR